MDLLFYLIVCISDWYDKLDPRRLKDNAYRNVQVNRLASLIKECLETHATR